MKCRFLFPAALALAALGGCDTPGGPAGPDANQSPGGWAGGTFGVVGLLLSDSEVHPLPVPIFEGTAPTRCDAGDRPSFRLHRASMVVTGESFRMTMRVSEDCWDWDRLVYYSPQPAFRDIVHQGSVSEIREEDDWDPNEGDGEGPGGPPEPKRGHTLAFTDESGARVYHGWLRGDSLSIGAQHQGGDIFLGIRQ